MSTYRWKRKEKKKGKGMRDTPIATATLKGGKGGNITCRKKRKGRSVLSSWLGEKEKE